MAKKKKNPSGLPKEVQEEIIMMAPEALAVDVTFEHNAVEALRDQKKKDHQIEQAKAKVDQLTEERDAEADVVAAKEALAKVLEDSTSEDLLEAKADLSALNKGWNDDIKNRQKKLKFMQQTLKRHIESGALKRK